MRAVIHLDDDLTDVHLAGRPVRAHLAALLREAGFELVDDAGDDLALHVEGRFAAVTASTLERLRLPGDAAATADGRIVAALVHGRHEISGASGDTIASGEAHDIRSASGRSQAERAIRRRIARGLEASGVRVIDPDQIVVDSTVRVMAGATLWPGVVLRGRTTVASGAEIRSGCWLEDTEVGQGAVVKPHSVCEGATIGAGSQVGPMAHLRPGAVLVGDNKVGNFVEVKKATLGRGAKASHLTYLGDAEIGAGANIGAGTITCNYDGHRKHRTNIGEGAFIGSNTALVAPISIGDGAIVGAGSTLSRDVPADALAVVRGETRILKGKGKALNERNARLKARETEEG